MLLTMPAGSGGEGGAHHPHSIFTGLWRWVNKEFPAFSDWYGFNTKQNDLGEFWFDAIGFSLLASILLITGAFLATRSYSRVPRGLQNVFEWAVQLLRNMVNGIVGPGGDKYVPYLGTVFLFILTMNLMGVVPGFRSPTMTLSTTAALGITTFIMVQSYAIRATGFVAYIKHFMGPVAALAFLMLPIEFIGELARPLSLSLRLFGNIFGEDKVIENLMDLGHGVVPVQLPMLFLAIFTSFLQAFIFTTLSTIYIATKVVHEDHGEGHGEHHGEADAHGAHHA
jgi:F-type H+-transporting ATPase subunit a